MEIKYLCPYWGSEDSKPNTFINYVKEKGYDGLEINIPDDTIFENNFYDALNKVRIESPSFICGLQQVYGLKKETPQKYLEKILKRLKGFVHYRPNFINSHTGKDHFSFSDNCKIIDAIEEFSVKHNIPIYHEIHRGRFTFHSLGTLKYIEVFPNLKFVGDLSHWCVSESMLQDQEEIINKIIPKTRHIHARIGFEQSPQVNNPFAPEWNKHFNQYVKWWQDIINYHSRYRTMTITPEFGPFPYMPNQSFTQEPRSDQKLINIEMRNHLKSVLK